MQADNLGDGKLWLRLRRVGANRALRGAALLAPFPLRGKARTKSYECDLLRDSPPLHWKKKQNPEIARSLKPPYHKFSSLHIYSVEESHLSKE